MDGDCCIVLFLEFFWCSDIFPTSLSVLQLKKSCTRFAVSLDCSWWTEDLKSLYFTGMMILQLQALWTNRTTWCLVGKSRHTKIGAGSTSVSHPWKSRRRLAPLESPLWSCILDDGDVLPLIWHPGTETNNLCWEWHVLEREWYAQVLL